MGWTLDCGADFLFTRPHFSEATAFVRGTQTPSSFNATAQDLDFQYTSSFRVFAGYQFNGTDTQLRFTYTRFNDQTEEDAGNFPPGHFAVDPFGNVAGVATVIDPSRAEFGHQIVGGDHIQASAEVDANIFDLDLIKPILWVCGGCEFKYTAGVRIARFISSINRSFRKADRSWVEVSMRADFTGAGPRIGIPDRSIFRSLPAVLTVRERGGLIARRTIQYELWQSTTGPTFQATQNTDEIRLIARRGSRSRSRLVSASLAKRLDRTGCSKPGSTLGAPAAPLAALYGHRKLEHHGVRGILPACPANVLSAALKHSGKAVIQSEPGYCKSDPRRCRAPVGAERAER